MSRGDALLIPWEPRLSICANGWWSSVSWERIDAETSKTLGQSCLGIPSVRVGISWVLDYLGYRRHADVVLVPRFLGRCILNAINRYAMPAETVSDRTRLVVVVHQFGFQQRLVEIHARCRANGWWYLEDSPYGIAEKEALGVGSLAKFIGLSKILPVLKGAMMLTEDARLRAFIKAKRAETSWWSYPLWLMLALLRRRRSVGSHSVLAEIAYELYDSSRGDHPIFRGNIMRGLRHLASYEGITAERLAIVKGRLGCSVLLPDTTRVAYVVPLLAQGRRDDIAAVLNQHRFDSGLYHLDLNRNLFDPDYQPVFLIPLNSQIPQRVFHSLIDGLSRVVAEAEPVSHVLVSG